MIEGAVGLYLVSAAVATWLSFDASAAWERLALIAAAVAVYALVAARPRQRAAVLADRLVMVVLAGGPTLLAVFFIVTNDWSHPVDKVSWLDPIRSGLGAVLGDSARPSLHPNVVGGILAVLLPMQTVALGLLPARLRGRDRVAVPGPLALRGIALAIAVIGVLVSGLRGAWVALVIATAAGVATARLFRTASPRRRRWAMVGALLLIPAVISMLLATAAGTSLHEFRADRWTVWANSLTLAGDYAVTGIGLGGFAMAYSSYALLIHVPFLTHAHNLFLDVWLDQGLLGLAAWLAVLVCAFFSATELHRRSSLGPRTLAFAALVSLLTLVIHGCVDDVFYGYGGVGLPCLFLPVAVLARDGAVPRPTLDVRVAVAAGAGLTLLAAVLYTLPSMQAVIDTNLGAVAQTRSELSRYRWPEWPVQDALRRADPDALVAAVNRYQRALHADPANAAANRRLGQVELSLGHYEEARRHLSVAYRVRPSTSATQQLYGESLALTGEPAQAAAVWRAAHISPESVRGRLFWYDATAEAGRAAAFRQAVDLTETVGRAADSR